MGISETLRGEIDVLISLSIEPFDLLELSFDEGTAWRIYWHGYTPITSGVTIGPFIRLNGLFCVSNMS